MGKTERKDGLYHVLQIGSGWTFAKWNNGCWSLIGSRKKVTDDQWWRIGPRIPEYKPKRKGKS